MVLRGWVTLYKRSSLSSAAHQAVKAASPRYVEPLAGWFLPKGTSSAPSDGRTTTDGRFRGGGEEHEGGEGVTRSPADKLTSKHPSSFSVGRSPVRPSDRITRGMIMFLPPGCDAALLPLRVGAIKII